MYVCVPMIVKPRMWSNKAQHSLPCTQTVTGMRFYFSRLFAVVKLCSCGRKSDMEMTRCGYVPMKHYFVEITIRISCFFSYLVTYFLLLVIFSEYL